ncbi:hypothetical protein [uncultured Chitinophaga sp.]|uniref:hypothetical protein n=1 Tax=uncultured Chitinophaga sp. TaxID=339340 RepID=UPI0025EBC6CB|nr:hypothetical protein [uncultured Chitinophaga sp.]
MIAINDISINDFPFTIKDFVGRVLFHEINTTSVFSSNENKIIIKEWVDCSDDGSIDRYFYYSSGKLQFRNFIQGKLSHLEFINGAEKGLLFFEDVKVDQVIQRSLTSVVDLPSQYKPEPAFKLQKSEVVDYEKIFEYFRLDNIDESTFHKQNVKVIADKDKSETYDLHIAEGFGVTHGTVESGILSKVLGSFDAFYKEISLDSIKGRDRGKLNFTQKDKSPDKVKLKELCSTLVYKSLAASFSVLIKPMATSLSNYNTTSMTEPAAINLFSLISSSTESKELIEEVTKYSSFTLAAYKDFVKVIHEQNLFVDLSWYNPQNDKKRGFVLNRDNSYSILDNIERLNTTQDDTVERKGKFRALNINSGSFSFTTEAGENFSGLVEKERRDGLYVINFIDKFSVSIRTTVQQLPGKKEPVRSSVLLSYFVDND